MLDVFEVSLNPTPNRAKVLLVGLVTARPGILTFEVMFRVYSQDHPNKTSLLPGPPKQNQPDRSDSTSISSSALTNLRISNTLEALLEALPQVAWQQWAI